MNSTRELLLTAESVPRFMEYCVLAAALPRNKRGGHGAGEAPHDVPQEIAEAVIAAAAVAVSYLCKCYLSPLGGAPIGVSEPRVAPLPSQRGRGLRLCITTSHVPCACRGLWAAGLSRG